MAACAASAEFIAYPRRKSMGSQMALAPQSGPVGYVFTGYWTWLSDCQARGRDGVLRDEWEGYVCINGSWVPGDDYELRVRHW
jgi:hypothetical protein